MKTSLATGWIVVAIAGILATGVIAAALTDNAESAPSEQLCDSPVYVIVMYEVKKGDTWRKIAQRYETSVGVLKSMNPDAKLVAGATLRAPILISCLRNQASPLPVQTYP